MKITRRQMVLVMTSTALASGATATAETPALKPLSTFIPKDPPAPPAEAQFFDSDGAVHTIHEFLGQGLVINLWATWCVPCVAEMPALQAMAIALTGEKIVVLPLSSDRGGAAVVRKF